MSKCLTSVQSMKENDLCLGKLTKLAKRFHNSNKFRLCRCLFTNDSISTTEIISKTHPSPTSSEVDGVIREAAVYRDFSLRAGHRILEEF